MDNQNNILLVPMTGSISTALTTAVNTISACQNAFSFELINESAPLPDPDMDDGYSWTLLTDVLDDVKERAGASMVIGVLDQPIEKNWFSYIDREKAKGFVTTYEWASISKMPVDLYVASGIVHSVVSILAPDWVAHKDTIDCIGDFCENKADIVESIRSGSICEACEEKLLKKLGSYRYQAVATMLKSISAKHWNRPCRTN